MSTNKEIIGKAEAVAGDILCAKSNGSKMIFKAAEYSDIDGSDWTPIGVVVVPPSHNIYGTGEGAVVSLKWMHTSYPDSGFSTNIQIYWGDTEAGTIFSTKYDGVNKTDNKSYNCTGISNVGILPTGSGTKKCYTDPQAYYSSTVPYSPSPYYNDNRNSEYYTNRFTNDEYTTNALSDFNGKSRTDRMISLATGQSDWKTASKITNSSWIGYYPAACCCWRYCTTGTKQGDWYLPAIGELGYLQVRRTIINNTLKNISGSVLPSSGRIWSSTEYNGSDIGAWLIEFGISQVGNNYKSHHSTYVRSFFRF